MAERTEVMKSVFDFSLEAQGFRERLRQRLLAEKPSPALQPLEDDDLEWVSAAGMIDCVKEKDPFP